MKRKHLEAARQLARDGLIGGGAFDWRDLAEPERPRPTRTPAQQLNAVQREILKLHKQGLPATQLAALFALDDATVEALLFGAEGSA